jgi:hypothetical protein
LEVEIGANPHGLSQVLDALTGSLQELNLDLDEYSTYTPRRVVRKIFAQVQSPLYALRHVRISYVDDLADAIGAVLDGAPNLQILRIHHRQRKSKRFSPPSTNQIIGVDTPPLSAPRLLEIDLDLSPKDAPAIAGLVEGAFRLRRVALRCRGSSSRWAPAESGIDALLESLARLDDLNCLAISLVAVNAVSEISGFARLQVLTILWDEHEQGEDMTNSIPVSGLLALHLSVGKPCSYEHR